MFSSALLDSSGILLFSPSLSSLGVGLEEENVFWHRSLSLSFFSSPMLFSSLILKSESRLTGQKGEKRIGEIEKKRGNGGREGELLPSFLPFCLEALR